MLFRWESHSQNSEKPFFSSIFKEKQKFWIVSFLCLCGCVTVPEWVWLSVESKQNYKWCDLLKGDLPMWMFMNLLGMEKEINSKGEREADESERNSVWIRVKSKYKTAPFLGEYWAGKVLFFFQEAKKKNSYEKCGEGKGES